MVTNPTPGGGKKRSLDAEINLVPFIDLLSMCICFLLSTAVWIQMGSLEVKQSHGTEASNAQGLEMDVQFTGPSSVQISLKDKGRVTKKSAVQGQDLASLIKNIDGTFAGWPLKKADATTAVSLAMVTTASSVSYGNLVAVMDVLRRHQISNIGVVPVGGRT